MEQEQNPEIVKLKSQLSETLAAGEFFESAAGKLWTELATKQINQLVKDITSDKYIKDHAGYVQALSELKIWRTQLRGMQLAASPARKEKIKERLEQHGITE